MIIIFEYLTYNCANNLHLGRNSKINGYWSTPVQIEYLYYFYLATLIKVDLHKRLYKQMYQILENYLINKTELGTETIKEICSYFQKIETKRNEILLNYNDISNRYYFINKGCIRIFTISKDGIEHSRYFAFEGNFATALPSFIEQKPAEEYLQTIQKSELLFITRRNFYHLVNTVPQFAKIYTEILEFGFIIAQKRIYGFQGFDALDKVKWIIKYQPQLLLKVSNKLVASYLGISPSTLSRLKSKL